MGNPCFIDMFPSHLFRLCCINRWLALVTICFTGVTARCLAQDPADNLGEQFPALHYLTGTLVYTPADGSVPRRLRMAMFLGSDGQVSARTERVAPGELPFRYWLGYARPQPEIGPIADSFYGHPRRSVVSTNLGSYNVLPLPNGLVAAGPLQPINNVGDSSPNLSLGLLNFRLANHRAAGGGIDPDGSTYAFDLREQTIMPFPDPGTFIAHPPATPVGMIELTGTLVVTHPDGQVDRLAATGYIDTETKYSFIDIPTLTQQAGVVGIDFMGQSRYSELRGAGDKAINFGAESNGFLRVNPALQSRFPGITKIGVAMHYGRLTGGCVADDGTAYSFVLVETPSPLTTIGQGF